jgi:hypothetical protein
MLNKHPEDFRLFQLGEYDDNSGFFDNLDEPVLLARSTDFVSTE